MCLVQCSGACNRGHQANTLPYIYRKYKVNQGDNQLLFSTTASCGEISFLEMEKAGKTVQMHLRTQTSVQRPPDICKPIEGQSIITIPATLTYNSGEKARHMCWPETTQQLVSYTTPEIWYNLQIYARTLSAVLSSASTSTPNHHFVRPPVQFQPWVPDGTLSFYNNTISYICLGKAL